MPTQQGCRHRYRSLLFGVQPLHVIIKPEKKPRLVIDLSRNLNDHLDYEYFSYSSVREAVERSTPRCWYCKLDLTNCFLSFPLHPSAQPHFIFEFEGQLYQFTRMPFGLSSVPRICTMLLSVVAFRFARLGISEHLRFLDDFLLIEREEHAALTARLTAESAFRDFGLVVNTEKTEGPAQRIAFLGVMLDSVKQTLECTPERLNEAAIRRPDPAWRATVHEASPRRPHRTQSRGQPRITQSRDPSRKPASRGLPRSAPSRDPSCTQRQRAVLRAPPRTGLHPSVPSRHQVLARPSPSVEWESTMAQRSGHALRVRVRCQPFRLRLLHRIDAAFHCVRAVAHTPPGWVRLLGDLVSMRPQSGRCFRAGRHGFRAHDLV